MVLPSSRPRRSGGAGRRVAATGGLAAASAGAAAWAIQRRIDRRRVEADPEHAQLSRPIEGRARTVRAVDGTALHAEIFGPDGTPTLVLIHGWTMALRFWHYQLRDLAGDLRIVAFDLRGHGRSAPPPTGDYSTEALAGDLQAVLEACVPEGERALLAGHSLGAMTMVAWAAGHPEEVERRAAAAALICTGMGDLISETLAVRVPGPLGRVKQGVGRALLSTPLPVTSGPLPLTMRAVRYVAMSRGASPARVAFCEQMTRACRPGARAGCGGSLAALDLYAGVERLAVPALVVAGGRDRLTPPTHARRLAAALPQLVELVEVPDVGHMAPVEAPEAVTGKLRELAVRELGTPAAAPCSFQEV